MRTFILIFILVSFHAFAQASQIIGQVHDIDQGSLPHEETLIFLTNGTVAKLHAHQVHELNLLHRARYEKQWLKLSLDEEREILSFTKVTRPEIKNQKHSFLESYQDFNPTLIDSMETARKIFNDARYDPRESECYNRAHVWSYEWRMNYKLLTSKMWLFFTRKYIRKYNFEWWFHVAPVFHVNIDNRMMERVADVKYARAPLRVKQWTDIFMRNDAECPLVENYSDGANYPESRWCYTMKTSMYYYQPIDLEAIEKYGVFRNTWLEEDLRNAYLEAYGITL